MVPKLEGQFNVRVLKEFGNSTATQGHAVVAGFTFFVDRPFRKMEKAMAEAAKAKMEAEEKAKQSDQQPQQTAPVKKQ